MKISDDKNGVTLSIDDRGDNQGVLIRAILRNPQTNTDIFTETLSNIDGGKNMELNTVTDITNIETENFILSLNMGDRIYNDPEKYFWQSAQIKSSFQNFVAQIYFLATKEDLWVLRDYFSHIIRNNTNLFAPKKRKGKNNNLQILFTKKRLWSDGYGFLDVIVSSDIFKIRRSIETDTNDMLYLLKDISDYIDNKNPSLEIIYDNFFLNITPTKPHLHSIKGEICDFSWPESNNISFNSLIDIKVLIDAQISLRMLL